MFQTKFMHRRKFMHHLSCRPIVLVFRQDSTAIDEPAKFQPMHGHAILVPAIKAWFASMGSSLESQWLANFKAFVHANEGVIKVGSICSGCDIMFAVMKALAEYVAAEYDIHVKFQNVFQCESDPDKRANLMRQSPAECVFASADELGRPSAYDLRSQSMQLVPWVSVLTAGFPCSSRTKLSCRSSQMKGCVRDGVGSTGSVFHDIFNYIKQNRPQVLLLENVAGLQETNEDGNSDAGFIMNCLSDQKYSCVMLDLSAAAYGSLANRDRLYFVAVSKPDDKAGSLKGLMMDLASSMQIPRFDAASFVCTQVEVWRLNCLRFESMCVSQAHFPGRSVSDPSHRDEHCELYRLISVTWPPVVSERYSVFAVFGERITEAAIWLDLAYPQQHDVEFVDLNSTLGRLTGFAQGAEFAKLKNPWAAHASTITSKSRFAIRIRSTTTAEFGSWIRPVEGFEAMAMIGYGLDLWDTDVQLPSYEMAISLAGNAFSAYSCGPALIALLGVAGSA